VVECKLVYRKYYMTQGSDKYKLGVELIGYDKEKPDMAVFKLFIADASGVVIDEFYGRSGPYGNGAFPGLQNDFFNIDDPEVNAVFKLQNSNDYSRDESKFLAHGSDEGYFINILTPDTGRFACGIHPDRGAKGTLGCLGLNEDHSKKFMEKWEAINPEQRPDEIVVYKPKFEPKRKNLIEMEDSYRERKSLLLAGSKGKDVERLQTMLIKMSHLPEGEDDGKFGAKTALAVKKFQQEHNLRVDGIVGPETFGKFTEIAMEAKSGKDVEFSRESLNSDDLEVVADTFRKYDINSSPEFQKARGVYNIDSQNVIS
jgi:hypothetical protein